MVWIRSLQCRTSLVDKQFGSKADRIYCGPCYDAQFATRCDGCGDVFKAGEQMKCHIDLTSILVLQVWRRWSTKLVSGTRSASSAAPARIPSAPRASSRRSTTSTAPSVMKRSLRPSASSAARWSRREVWLTATTPGIGNASPAPTARSEQADLIRVDLTSFPLQVPRWTAVHLQGRQALLCGQFTFLTRYICTF